MRVVRSIRPKPSCCAPFTSELAISYATLGQLKATDYTHAQRVRSGLRREVAQAFADVDLLALPTTAAPAARVTDAEFESGFLDPRTLDAYCRFAFLGNLTGLPALNAPVGLDGKLPLGLQLVGDAWDEATVLAAAAHLERAGVAHARSPWKPVERAIEGRARRHPAGLIEH